MNDIMDKEILQKLHNVELEIMDEFVKICTKHNLQYFLIGGSLIGAVRHQGFIPWDDDLDVAMPRSDYEKFLNIVDKELGEEYFIDNFYSNKKYYLNFTKLRKKNTLFVQDFQINYDGPKEIWIDILPLDDLKKEKSFIGDTTIRFIKLLRSISHYRMGFFLGNNKIAIKKIIGFCFKLFNAGTIMKFANYLMKFNYSTNTKYFVNIASQYNFRKQTIEKERYFPAVKLKFEGREYYAPRDYDYVLKRIYGNYMELPPKEKQITHNPVILSFDVKKDFK